MDGGAAGRTGAREPCTCVRLVSHVGSSHVSCSISMLFELCCTESHQDPAPSTIQKHSRTAEVCTHSGAPQHVRCQRPPPLSMVGRVSCTSHSLLRHCIYPPTHSHRPPACCLQISSRRTPRSLPVVLVIPATRQQHMRLRHFSVSPYVFVAAGTSRIESSAPERPCDSLAHTASQVPLVP